MRLSNLLQNIFSVDADRDVWIEGITQDSRHVRPGDLFLAYPGLHKDGRIFIPQAIAKGAAAVLYENINSYEFSKEENFTIPLLDVKRLDEQVGIIASRFYHHPSAQMTTIGVTGTNGKTSVTQFVAQALNYQQRCCAVIGTLGTGLLPNLQSNGYTTPHAVELQRNLSMCLKQGADSIAMEVSSHSLSEHRVDGTEFKIAVFTNLTQDHLDFHGNMREYGAAKARLFQFPSLRYAIFNGDDIFGQQLAREQSNRVNSIFYTIQPKSVLEGPTVVMAEKIRPLEQGFHVLVNTPWGRGEFTTSLLGEFNISNLLAVLSTLGALEVPLADSLDALSRLQSISGRMQCFGGGSHPRVVVDYAHTPDALQQVLCALREHRPRRLWCIFGCGGNRDRGKRSQMGRIAEQYSDQIILTNDNPRDESPLKIINDIKEGLHYPERPYVELDRAAAIAYAIQEALVGDIILIAGKGHETKQTIGDQVLDFNDSQQIQNLLKDKHNTAL